jgi:ankyrin repeat protein
MIDHLPVVQYLCEQGADKEARGDGGKTPLLWAELLNHHDIADYLSDP